MPKVTLNKKEVLKLVGKNLPDDKLADRISMLGTDLDKITKDEIEVEIFPNRPDLLSEQGFARALSSFIGIKKGLRAFKVEKSGYKTFVKNPIKELPYAVTGIAKGLKLSDTKIKELIQIQEKLSVTFLRNRKKGAMGIYPIENIKFPITFTSENPDIFKFRPLEYPSEITGRQILSKHPTGRKYACLCENWSRFPLFRDADNKILSMPPVINSHDMGKITEQTKNVFVELTGTDLRIINQAFTIIMTALSDMGGKIYSMDVVYKDKTITTPDVRPTKMKIKREYVNKLIGLNLYETEFKDCLERMGFGYQKGELLIPCYRVDILHPCDIAEDVAIAYGYENLIPEIPNVSTLAYEDPYEIFKERIANILVGFELLEVKSFHLTNKEQQNTKMLCDLPLAELDSCMNTEYNMLRTWMIPCVLETLERNKHHEYPQNLFDVGTIFKIDSLQETGILEQDRLAVVLCGPDTDYTKIRQILDSLFQALDMTYKVEAAKHPSFLPGRVGRVICGKTKLAYIGELDPQVLTNFNLEFPVACFELNLSELWKEFKKD